MPCVAVSSCSRMGPLMGSILQPSSSTRDAALYWPMPAHTEGRVQRLRIQPLSALSRTLLGSQKGALYTTLGVTIKVEGCKHW